MLLAALAQIPSAVPELEVYGTAHVVVILLTFGLPLALRFWVLRGQPSARVPTDLRQKRLAPAALIMAGTLLACLPAKLIYTLTYHSRPWQELLPLQLCDLAAVIIILALVTRRQLLFEFAYYWGLAGTLQALLTPDLDYGYPHPYFFFFFISHGGIIAGALTLVSAGGMKPTLRGLAIAFAGVLGYALAVFLINSALGTNYGYVNGKPKNPSLMDHLWPWPLYIIQLAGIALVEFLIFWLPHAPFWRRGRGKVNREARAA